MKTTSAKPREIVKYQEINESETTKHSPFHC